MNHCSVSSSVWASAALLCLAAVLAGCGAGINQQVYVPPTGAYTGILFSGQVLAGTQPVIGATVQLYTAGTGGNASAPTALLSTGLITDSHGGFTVPAYTCAASTSILYIVATGGHVGSGSSNSAITLMTSPGPCNSSVLSATSSTYTMTVNELTTVASAYALGPFLGAGAQLGASSTNTGGIALAAATLANLVNVATGTAPGAGFPATGVPPLAKLDTLANLLNSCIVSSGPSSSACSSFFSDVATSGTPPGNTLDAVLDLAKSPGTKVSTLYGLSLASSAYAPVLTAAPADWTLFVTYTGGGMNDPSALSIDSKGNVWVANYFSVASLFTNTGTPVYGTGITGNGLNASYGGAVDANDVMWIANEPGSQSSVTLLKNTGSAASGSPYTAGGLNFPVSIAFDATGVSWIVDYGNSHLTLLTNGGTPVSGTSGYSGVDSSGVGHFVFPVAVAVDGNRNGWVANQSANTVVKVAPDGSSYTSYPCCNGPDGVAVDAANNVWVASYYSDGIALISSAGSVLSPGQGYTGGGIDHPQGIAVDGGGTVWVANYRAPGISELAGAGAKAGTGTLLSPSTGWGPDANLLEAFALAIDASGNIWVTNFGSNTLTEFVGMAVPVKTPLIGTVRVP